MQGVGSRSGSTYSKPQSRDHSEAKRWYCSTACEEGCEEFGTLSLTMVPPQDENTAPLVVRYPPSILEGPKRREEQASPSHQESHLHTDCSQTPFMLQSSAVVHAEEEEEEAISSAATVPTTLRRRRDMFMVTILTILRFPCLKECVGLLNCV